MPYTPHTEDDIREMLLSIGISKVDDLYAEIPEHLLYPEIDLAPPLSEPEVRDELIQLSEKNIAARNYLCLVGAGAYQRYRPSLVDRLISRGEFSTSYTPYQAEVSQGTLQFIFEFQTMIAALTGLPVANASMYDGASALAEAALMAVRITKRQRILYAATLHPRWKETLKTYLSGSGADLVEVPCVNGVMDLAVLSNLLDSRVAALLVQHPNFYGYLECVDELKALLLGKGILWVHAADPVSLAVLSSPGELGADIAVGEVQSLGLPLSFGGPYAGYFACREEYVRQMPGRIVGRTHDVDGRLGYVLTLQTREQHIRREKSTSNICTNQSLCALAATIYLALLGPRGLCEVAEQNHAKAAYLEQRLVAIPGVRAISDRPFFNEFTLELPMTASVFADKMKVENIIPGLVDPHWTGAPNRIVVCVTEVCKQKELDRAAEAYRRVLGCA